MSKRINHEHDGVFPIVTATYDGADLAPAALHKINAECLDFHRTAGEIRRDITEWAASIGMDVLPSGDLLNLRPGNDKWSGGMFSPLAVPPATRCRIYRVRGRGGRKGESYLGDASTARAGEMVAAIDGGWRGVVLA